jgi:hypothetical protein
VDSSSFVEYVKIRRQSGETLKQIGADFGVSTVAVYYWCKGQRQPTRNVCRMADLLVREQLARGVWKDRPQLAGLDSESAADLPPFR